MIELFNAGGWFMWPILACALLVLGISAKASRSFARNAGAERARILSASDAVLFWGGFAAVLGVMGTIGGIAQMASAIERFGGASAQTVWSGIKVTLVTSMAGLATLTIALLLWLALRAVQSRRLGGTT